MACRGRPTDRRGRTEARVPVCGDHAHTRLPTQARSLARDRRVPRGSAGQVARRRDSRITSSRSRTSARSSCTSRRRGSPARAAKGKDGSWRVSSTEMMIRRVLKRLGLLGHPVFHEFSPLNPSRNVVICANSGPRDHAYVVPGVIRHQAIDLSHNDDPSGINKHRPEDWPVSPPGHQLHAVHEAVEFPNLEFVPRDMCFSRRQVGHWRKWCSPRVWYYGHVASIIDADPFARWLPTRTGTPFTPTLSPTPARPGLARPCVVGFRIDPRIGPLVLNPGGRADLILETQFPGTVCER